MRVVIENRDIKVEIESEGAELRSLVRKETNQEYMWEADPDFWSKTSPLLFPFIGKLEEFQYRYRGGSYEMTKHGFAKDMDFRVERQEADSVVFAVDSSEQTMGKYPFRFTLEVEYRLEGSSLWEQWKVYNRGEDTMYFSVGGHPAFACPLRKQDAERGSRTGCFVKLYGVEEKTALSSSEIDISVGLISGNTFPVSMKEGVFPISDHMFDGDALLFAEQGVTAAALLDETGKEYIRLEAPSCPVWGIWSMPENAASFVCFEPWWGSCDRKGYRGDLEDRPYTNRVEAGEVWKDGFRIVVGE